MHHESSGGQTQACTNLHKMRLGCRSTLPSTPKELAAAETVSHAGDSVLPSPDVSEIESLTNPGATGQTAAMNRNTTDNRTGIRKLVRNPVVERAGGAAPQADVSQAQTMNVSRDQKATTTATKQRAGTQVTTNNVESGIGIKLSEQTRCCPLRQ